MTETLANLSWQAVLGIVAVLAVIRLLLGNSQKEYEKSIAEIAESLAIAMALVFFIIRPFFIQAFFIPSGSMHVTLLENDHILVNKLGYRIWQPKAGDVVVFKSPPNASPDHVEKDYIKRLIGVPGDTIEVKGGEITAGRRVLSKTDVTSALIDKRVLDPMVDDFHDNLVKYFKDSVLVRGWRQEDNRWERIERTLSIKELAQVLDVKSSEIKITPGVTLKNGKVMDEPYTAEDPVYTMSPVKIKPGDLWVMGDNRNNSNDCHVWGPLERKRLLGKAMFIFWPVNRIRIIH